MCEINWAMLLEYLKVLLNWPPLIALLGAWFTYLFREEIAAKLKALHQVKVGGQEAVFKEQIQAATPVAEVKLPGEDNQSAQQHAAQQINYYVSAEAAFLAGSPEGLQQAIDWAEANPGPTVEEFLRLSEKLQFEKIFTPIYGTQLAALVFLSKSNTPQPISSLQAFADSHRERTAAEATDLEMFLAYLFGQQLLFRVEPQDLNLVTLSVRGQRFLNYIQAEYPISWQNRLW